MARSLPINTIKTELCMNEQDDYLESIKLEQSTSNELLLIDMGLLLYRSLVKADVPTEVQLLYGFALEYSLAVSHYAELTGRIEESLAVDLIEALQFKEALLTKGKAGDDWKVYAENFKRNLVLSSKKLDIHTD